MYCMLGGHQDAIITCMLISGMKWALFIEDLP